MVFFVQKQPSMGVLRNRCSENMLQIYRRTPLPICDFNKVAFQLYWNRTPAWVFSCIFSAYFQNTFYLEHLWVTASLYLISKDHVIVSCRKGETLTVKNIYFCFRCFPSQQWIVLITYLQCNYLLNTNVIWGLEWNR